MVANNIQEFWSRQSLMTIVALCSVQVIILRTEENSSKNQMDSIYSLRYISAHDSCLDLDVSYKVIMTEICQNMCHRTKTVILF